MRLLNSYSIFSEKNSFGRSGAFGMNMRKFWIKMNILYEKFMLLMFILAFLVVLYGLYDSWEPAISEFRKISERTGKDIDEGSDYYKIADWNPATGTAGYILKKHVVNGTRADEDEFCELFLAAAAEGAALGMSAFTANKIQDLADAISDLADDINANIHDAKKIFGDELPGTIKTAADTAGEVLRQLLDLMLKMLS